MLKMVSLVGARPQFVKEACLGAEVRRRKAWEHILIHSGQHYDRNMSHVFFDELEIQHPQHFLHVGSGSHAAMTAAILTGTEKLLQEIKPDGLIVYGDTNTTLAGSLAAAKLNIPVIHVEAGIRMLPRSMPEEINRVLTDRMASVLCCCSELGARNLRREGIVDGVHVTGDLMLDVFLGREKSFNAAKMCAEWDVRPGAFAVATLHRDYNVDIPARLGALLEGISEGARRCGIMVLLPVHPRTEGRLKSLGMEKLPWIRFIPPQGYWELMSLVKGSSFVITDSGGLQKEAAYAGKRSVVLMPDTGWRELIDSGWNILCGGAGDEVADAVERGSRSFGSLVNPYGDGRAACGVINAVLHYFSGAGRNE